MLILCCKSVDYLCWQSKFSLWLPYTILASRTDRPRSVGSRETDGEVIAVPRTQPFDLLSSFHPPTTCCQIHLKPNTCFLFRVASITARRPLRFRRKPGLQRSGARIAPSLFLLPTLRALLLPIVPPRLLQLSSLHARTALRLNPAGHAPRVPSGCRSQARHPEGGESDPSRRTLAHLTNVSSSSVARLAPASRMSSTALWSWRGQVHS